MRHVKKPLLALAMMTPLFLQSCGDAADESSSETKAYALNYDSAAGCGSSQPSNEPNTSRFCVNFDSYAAGSSTPSPTQTIWEMRGIPADKVELLRRASLLAMQAVEKHLNQKLKTGTSDLEACVARNADAEFVPAMATGTPATNDAKFQTNSYITGVKLFHFMTGTFNSTVGIFRPYSLPSADGKSYEMAKAIRWDAPSSPGGNRNHVGPNGERPGTSPLPYDLPFIVNINTEALKVNFTERDWAGAIIHEIGHMLGYTHDTKRSGTLIYELGHCVTNSNADSPGGASLVASNGMIMLDEVLLPVQAPGSSNKAPMCFYKHEKDTKGGKKGDKNQFDGNGQNRSCNPDGDWKTSCKDGIGDTKEVGCGTESSTPSNGAMCFYKHEKETKGGKKGDKNQFDVNGQTRSCDKNGDWKKSCKDGSGDTSEVSCQ
ncbi:MAG TPA: hypothetical protein VFO10_28690 [Oligoflexus sp.]|uniref:hypothetical protein n=1 Tax=Oligoflexus sp. TaxID=1971216 RepID=UPI002D801DA9|nr:hypothetical protein [Oligoflexus sp.]HET9241277.1 hypothetical protein [Oligoflexus sp.]